MIPIAYLILGIIIGGIIAWLIASSRARSVEAVNNELRQQIQHKDSKITQLSNEIDIEKQQKVKAMTELDASLKNLQEQKILIETMKQDMKDTFKALSSDVLKDNKQDFLQLASERLKPLQDALKKYEEQINDIEAKRRQDYGSLGEQLRMLASTHQQLQKETSNLVTALRKPQVRGRWGEMQLRRVAELSGMSMHCDFTEQQSMDTEKGRIRPDMIVHLPMGREIVVDSKVSLEAYLDALSASTEEDKKAKIEKHAQQIRAHINKLASKEYWSQFQQSPEFVVLFIPGESFLSAALDIDNTLIEDGIQKRVIIATPTTFIALLRAIAYGWRQEQITKNAQEISELGHQLYERVSNLIQHFENLGLSLEKAISSYNKAVGSMESRVLPSVRRFKELGVTGAEEIPVLEQIDQIPRRQSLLLEKEANE